MLVFPLLRRNADRQVLQNAQQEMGAEEGTRTPDPRITNALLYQLSYFGARGLFT
jgi:hypothetical protein